MGGVLRQGPPLFTQTAGASWISTKVASSTVFAAGKLGTSECDAIYWFLTKRNTFLDPEPYPVIIKKHITINAGIFPNTDAAIDEWCHHMITDVLPVMDGMAEWNPCAPLRESQILNAYSKSSVRFPLRSLEPYYHPKEHRWTLHIPDAAASAAHIAVVSPFASSISKQWDHRAAVWNTEPIWKDGISLSAFQTGFNPLVSVAEGGTHCTNGAWSAEIRDGGWKAAVESIVRNVESSGAKLAIIGCGALSLPIAAALKKLGISAIHLGGATQILFGIKGARWATHSVISTFFNDAWINVSTDEIPAGAASIENGCYW